MRRNKLWSAERLVVTPPSRRCRIKFVTLSPDFRHLPTSDAKRAHIATDVIRDQSASVQRERERERADRGATNPRWRFRDSEPLASLF